MTSDLLLILQVDHSKVTGWFAAHWGNDKFARPSPYAAMVLAAQEHDTGWWDWEIKPQLNSEGVPPDYIGSIKHLGSKVWLDFYRHGIERLAEQDPYAGYIVSLHSDGLLTQGRGLLPYMPDYKVYPEVQEFLREQESYRNGLMQQLKSSPEYHDHLSEEQIWTNFKLMEVYDQMGQFVCNRYPFNSTQRKNGPSNTMSNVPTPTQPGKADAILTFIIKDESRATVSPYPFDIDPLPVSFQGRLLPKRRYANQGEFLQEYYGAERIMINYSLHSV